MGPIRDLGPCVVEFNNVDLGATFGGVTFKYTEEGKDVQEDQKGVTPVDNIRVGVSLCEVEAVLTRTSLAILATIIGGSSYSGTGLNVNNQVGVSAYENAQALILKPIVDNDEGDEDTWLTLSKAYPIVDLEVVFNNEGQRVYKVTFKCFPNATSGLIWKIGG